MGKGYTIRTSVLFSGKQAAKEMAKLKDVANALENSISILSESMKNMDPESNAYQDAAFSLRQMQKELKSTQNFIDKGVERMQTYEDVLNNLSGSTMAQLQAATRHIKNLLQSTTDAKGLRKLADSFSIITARINEMKAGFADAFKAPGNLTKMSLTRLQELKNTLENMQSTTAVGSKQWKEYDVALSNVNNRIKDLSVIGPVMNNLSKASNSALSAAKKAATEIVGSSDLDSEQLARYQAILEKITHQEEIRTKNQVRSVMNNPQNYSKAEIEETVKLTEKLRDAQAVNTKEYKRFSLQIENAKATLAKYNNEIKQETMTKQLASVGRLSTAALREQKKFWQEAVEGANAGDRAAAAYRENLECIIAEEQKRMRTQSKKIMANPDDFSRQEIEEAIKLTEQLRDAHQLGSQEYHKYTLEINNAQESLKRYDQAMATIQMDKKIANVGSASTKSLEEQRKFWQEMVDGTEHGDAALTKYMANLKAVQSEQSRRANVESKNILSNPSSFTPAEIEQAIKLTEKLRAEQGLSRAEYEQYTARIEEGRKALDEYNLSLAKTAKENELGKLGQASEKSMQEQKKFWQAMVEGAQQGSAELSAYKKNLDLVLAEERTRAKAKAGRVMAAPQSFSKGEIEEAIKLTEQLRDAHQLGSQEYHKYTLEINNAQESLKRYDQAMATIQMDKKIANVGSASTKSLEEQRKFWQEMVDGTEHGDAALTKYMANLKAVQSEQSRRANVESKNVLSNPSSFTPAEIEQAIKLTEKLRAEQGLSRAEYEQYTARIEEGRKALDEYNLSLAKTAKENELGKLGQASEKSMQEQKKFWQAMVEGAQQGSAELSAYKKNLDLVLAEEHTRTKARAGRIMADPDQFSKGEIEEAIKLTEQLRDAQRVGSAEYDNYTKSIERAKETLSLYNDIARQQDMEDRLLNIGKASSLSMQEQKKFWQGMVDGAEKGSAALVNYQKNLDKVVQEENNRKHDKARDVMMSPVVNHTEEEIREAIKLTEELRSTHAVGSREYNEYTRQIKNATEAMKQQNDLVNAGFMERKLTELHSASTASVAEQRKFWEELVKGARQGSAELDNYSENLRKVIEEQRNRDAAKVSNVIASPGNFSKGEIEEAIKLTEQLRDTQELGSREMRLYSEQIEKLKGVLDEYNAKLKNTAMEDGLQNLGSASTKSLQEQKKYWQELVDSTELGNSALQKYRDNLQAVLAEEGKRNQSSIQNVLASPFGYSKTELEEAIKTATQIRNAISHTAPEFVNLTKGIESAKKALLDYEQAAGNTRMGMQLEHVANLSTNALQEQKKYWQEMLAQTEQGQAMLSVYEENLRKVNDEERKRLSNRSQKVMADLSNGMDSKSINEMQEDLKLLKEYRDSISSGQTEEMAEANKAMEQLSQRIEQVSGNYIELEHAIKQVEDISKGHTKASINELEQLKKALVNYRKIQDDTDSDQFKEIENSIHQVDKALQMANREIRDMDDFMKKLDDKTFNQLTKAAEQLKAELKDIAIGTDEYIKKSADLKLINERLSHTNTVLREQANMQDKTIGRLSTYFGALTSISYLQDRLRYIIDGTLKLSDSMADVQKTTGLTNVEMTELGKKLEDIDTRTATEELYNLAATAGQIGMKSQKDVLGFSKAANIISVSLNELGAEGSQSLVKIANLTGEIRNAGVENTLLKIGSSINELTANSAATAGPINDFIGRIGGIAASAKMSIAEMAALGATVDASGQSIEIAGTSMNKLISAMRENVQGISYISNVDKNVLQSLIDSGQIMEAIIRVFEAMEHLNPGETAKLMKEFGSEGARMNQFISSLVGNMDMLKTNLKIANGAYREGTSVIDEYNVKNENAVGILERMKNNMNEFFVNSRMANAAKSFLSSVADIYPWLQKHENIFLAIKLILAEMAIAKLPILLNTAAKGVVGLYSVFTSMFIPSLKSLKDSWNLATKAMQIHGMAVTGLTGKLRVLWTVMNANKLTAIISMITALGVAYLHFRENTDKLTKAQAELNVQHARERMELSALEAGLRGKNMTYQQQLDIIKELNREYSSYLGFEIQLEDRWTKKAAAIEYVNKKLRENQDLEMFNKSSEVVRDTFNQESKDDIENMREKLSAIPQITSKRWGEAFSIINRSIRNGATSTYSVLEELREHFQIDPGTSTLALVSSPLTSYMQKYKIFLKDMEMIQSEYDYNVRENQKEQIDALLALEKGHTEQIEKLTEERNKNTNPDHLHENNKKILEEMKKKEATIKNMVETQRRIDETLLNNAALHTGNAAQDTGNINAVKEAFGKEAAERVLLAQQLNGEIVEIEKRMNNASEEEQLRHYKELSAKQEEYQRIMSDLLAQSHSHQMTEFKGNLVEMGKTIDDFKVKHLKEDAWGKDVDISDWRNTFENLKTASVQNLVDIYKALTNDPKLMSADVKKYNQMMGTEFKNMQQAADDIYAKAQLVKQRLAELHRGTTGEFIYPTDGGRQRKKSAKEEVDAALAKLEEYFVKRREIITNEAVKDQVTEEEMQRRLQRNEEEHLNARMKLRRDFLGRNGGLSMKELIKYDLDDRDFDSIRKHVEKAGRAFQDGISLNIAKDALAIQEILKKHQDDLKKIILEDDFTEQVGQQYLEMLDKVQLLFGMSEDDITDRTREAGERRMEFMKQLAKESYLIESDGLKKKMESNVIFSDWVKGRTKEDYEALLVMLRKYHDDYEQAENRSIERKRRIAEKKWEKSGRAEYWNDYESAKNQDINMYKDARDLGIATDDMVNEKEVEMYHLKIAASEEYISQIKKEMEVEMNAALMKLSLMQQEYNQKKMLGTLTQEDEANLLAAQGAVTETRQHYIQLTASAEKDLADLKEGLAIKETDIAKQKMEKLKEYTDAIVDFSYQMGEAAFSEVGKRKEAANELLRVTMRMTKDLIMQKMKELITKKMLNKAEVAAEQAKNSELTAAKGSQAISGLSVEMAAMKGKVIAGGTEGAAKTIGELGWWGIPLVAVINAVLNGLMGLAMGALNKSKSEVQEITGVGGRLATGMLTYAKGDYPVLGNDGNIYNARYQKELKTGVYRGGAHFGIFSEKKPEAIIDGDTTQKLILNYPDIWNSILTISKNGRLSKGIPTFATGNIDNFGAASSGVSSAGIEDSVAYMVRMEETLNNNNQVMGQLVSVLQRGITADINMYGANGLHSKMEKANSFMKKRKK